MSHRSVYLLAFCLLLKGSFTVRAQDWKSYPYTPDGSLISFPGDEGWHPAEPIEWWYMAGHLQGESTGASYSFMLSYFYYPVDTFGISTEGFRILNLSNDDTGEFHTETMPVLNYADLATDHMHIDARLFNGVAEHWFHKEEANETLVPFEYELTAISDRDSISLTAVSRKRPLIPGGNGLFAQGATSYTYYYSLTDILVEGVLSFDGSSEGVSGTAWIDRQYGSFNPYTKESYEWFFLQLSNGTDLNIWNLFTSEDQLPDDPAYRHLSASVDEDNQYTAYDFELERLSWSLLPGSGNFYAQSWRLSSQTNQLDLYISTLHHNAEVRYPFPFFEGSVIVSGTVNGSPVSGKGFAELVKKYEAPVLNLVRPRRSWNENFPIQWELGNPDDGRPLLYDLAYSTDLGASWIPMAAELSDTFYYWNDHPFGNGDSCLFRVKGYTADNSLYGSYTASVHTVYDELYNLTGQDEFTALKVYPNPAADHLKIQWIKEFPLTNDSPSYVILDMMGRPVVAGILGPGNEIDVGMLRAGLYTLLLYTGEGKIPWIFFKE